MGALRKYKKITTSLFLVFFVAGFFVPVASSVIYASEQGEMLGASQMGGPGEKAKPDFGCFDFDGDTDFVAGCSALFSYYLMFLPAYKTAGIAGIAFNFSLDQFVVTMGEKVRSMNAVEAAWVALRNIGNVFLVFLLVWVGIATILGITSYGYKRLLWKIILAALLVNFSIFFAKLTIDVGNILAIGMYNQFIITAQEDPFFTGENMTRPFGPGNGFECTTNTPATFNSENGNLDGTDKVNCYITGISGAFWSRLGLTSIFDITSENGALTKGGGKEKQWEMFYTAFFGSFMFAIMAFVFGATAILFVLRFIILVFLIIVSPVALIAWITGVSSSGKEWWNKLIAQSIFPSLILLMWWVAFIVISDYIGTDPISLKGIGSVTSEGAGPAVGMINALTTFAIASGFLIAGLILASRLGAAGSKAVLNTGSRWSKRGAMMVGAGAGALTAGTAARIGRGTVGRGSAAYANSDTLKKQLDSDSRIVRGLARLQLAGAKGAANRSFDARSVMDPKIAKYTGKAKKGGYAKDVKDKAKKEEEIHKHVSTYTGSGKENKEYEKRLGNLDRSHKQEKRQAKNDLNSADRELGDAVRSGDENRIRLATQKRDAEKEIYKKKLAELESRKVANKNKIYNERSDAYKEKAEERKARSLDRMERSGTFFGIVPTPQWRKQQANKLRGKTKEEKVMEDIKKIYKESEGGGDKKDDSPKEDTDKSGDKETT